MAPPMPESAGSARVRSRRSFAQMPRPGIGSGIDKENMTADISAINDQRAAPQKPAGRDKKLRSKSLGPGGLDALHNGHGNGNRRKSTAQFPLKSILKPTVPVSPLRNIPSFEETRRRTPARSPQRSSRPRQSNNPNRADDPLDDSSTPPTATVVGTDNLANPFDGFNPSSVIRNATVALHTEEEQQAAAREREEKDQREREKQAILDHRAARRKSMANRRVSFAPEATLHTWNVVELAEDSTASSASTNSTRRASTLTADQSAHPSTHADATDPSSEQVDYPTLPAAPDQQTKSDRNSSASRRDSFSPDPAETFSSSPFSGSSAAGSDDTGVASLGAVNEDDQTDSDSDDDGATVMSIENMTERSISSPHSDASSTSSSTRLERSLRQAAKEAGTKGIDFDENGDLSMEFANHEIAGAFQPWVKKTDKVDFDLDDLSARQDQENLNPLAQPLSEYRPSSRQSYVNYDESDADMSMEITRAMGGIIRQEQDSPSPSKPRRKSVAPNESRRNSLRRLSTEETTNLGDQTMEFTNVVGGIAQNLSPSRDFSEDSGAEENEEMTMEFTSVLGGIQKANIQRDPSEEYEQQAEEPIEYEPEVFDQEADDEDMEMTGALGGILPPIEEQTEPEDNDETMGMEMTNALGKILPPQFNFNNRWQGKALMELETDAGQLASSPFQENIVASPPKSIGSQQKAMETESTSPTIEGVKRRQDRRSVGARESTTPRGDSRQSSPVRSPSKSPVKKPSTPSKQRTPPGARPSTPGKTPPSANVAFRSASPKKLFKPELRRASVQNTPPTANKLFHQDGLTGQTTPSFVLRPNRRPSSGLGIDREGLGSPRVAEILDRRRSIGEDAQDFVPQGQPTRGVRFDDPRVLEEEVDREQDQEKQRQYNVSETHAQGQKEPTLNLREMIQSLTPKKNKFKGRKSLHVGAAVGLLGKRPAELDEDDEEEEYSPKRLRGREGSPVKNVKLPAPPSKDETVRRTTRVSSHNGPVSSPVKFGSTTPKGAPRFGDIEIPTSEQYDNQNSASGSAANQGESPNQDEPEVAPLQLQEFLDMTNIHFMELTTTKRRHTLAPGSDKKRAASIGNEAAKGISLEDCVAAGFCTVPMLELYQHSCRELKSYISEGRQIIRSIETETYADNPPLFQEYVTAPPDIRLLMDNQFRNVKTHARLLSKSMWYEWRMKLLEGLKEGLNRHVEEMQNDESILSKKEELLDRTVPVLVEKHAKLEVEARNLQQAAEEMENSDKEELHKARERLAAVDAEIAAKKKLLEESQSDLENKNNIIQAGAELKMEYLAQIREAERVREECRGWSVKEVQVLKASVRALEAQTGWSILSASLKPSSKYGAALRMRYRDELQVDFYPGAFNIKRPASSSARRSSQPNKNLPVALSYAPNAAQGAHHTNQVPPPEKALILHALRMRTSNISQAAITPRQFLASISRAWDKAINVGNEIRALGYCGITRAKAIDVKSEPALLETRCMVLGWSTTASAATTAETENETTKHKRRSCTVESTRERARIDVDFIVKPRPASNETYPVDMDIDIDIDVAVSVVYGSVNNGGEAQIGEFLGKMVNGQNTAPGSGMQLGGGVWRDAVRKFERRVFV
ncbi:hypothetical protein FQN53_004778 [Emmonsiellopsis sp. PD_33]|nr:hypothetical protein FQN53_004778 [Emmonsiellopsis sp. PD_33]